jgi:SAM-dependent methyltransferase
MTPNGDRQTQTAYSDLQPQMHDEVGRRAKARKMRSVIEHFLGRDDLAGLSVLDIGSSTGYICDELAAAGARVAGLDIDVPGLVKAAALFGGGVHFVCGDGARAPFPDASFDVAIFNQVYEHVLKPEAVVAEIRRVLRPGGLVYLGLTSKRVLVEPHYRLPLLSYLPPRWADSYVRVTGRADRYHEELKSYGELRQLFAAWQLWDYTIPVVRNPRRFAAFDVVPGPAARVPEAVYRLGYRLLPGYIWLGVDSGRIPAGPPILPGPRLLSNG